MRRLLLFLLLFVSACQSSKKENVRISINVVIDSLNSSSFTVDEKLSMALEAEASFDKNESSRSFLELLKSIGELYYNSGDSKKAKSYFIRAYQVAAVLKDKENLGICSNNIGFMYDELGNIDSALYYYFKADEIFKSRHDSLSLSQGLVNIGIAYKKLGKYEEAIKYSLEAAEIFRILEREENLSASYTTIANCLKILNRFDKALYYHQEALKLRRHYNDSAGIAASLNNIGNVFRHQLKYEEAIDYYYQSLNIKKNIGDKKTIATTIDNLAETYLEIKKYSTAEVYFKKALELRESDANIEGYLTSAERISRLYFTINKVSKAEDIAISALCKIGKRDYPKQRYEIEILLSLIYKQKENYKLAFQYASSAMQIKDSIFNTDMSAQIAKLETAFRTKEKEQELLYAKEIQQNQNRQIFFQKAFILVLTCLMIILVVLSYYAYKLSIQRKKAKEKVELVMSELNHRVSNNLQTISDILRIQLSQTNNPDHIKIIEAERERILTMSVIHKLLNNNESYKSVHMRQFMSELIKSLRLFYSNNAQNLFIDVQDILLASEQAIAIGLIANELISNVYKHCKKEFKDIMLDITIKEHNHVCELVIEDNCEYWDVKGMQQKRKGLGLLIIEKLVMQINGVWDVDRSEYGMMHVIKFQNGFKK